MIPKYSSTTSDHFPELSRFRFEAAGVPETTSGRVIINEVLVNELGSDTRGEFVEIVNVGDAAADLSGMRVSVNGSIAHVFDSSQSLPAHQAFVIYGGKAAIPQGLTNAAAASVGRLRLNNSGAGVVSLENTSGATIDTFAYPETGDDRVSFNRSPDATKDAEISPHDELSTYRSSPGVAPDGRSYVTP